MRPTLTIADIYESPARAKVLRALALASRPMSVRRVATRAGISHTAAGATLRDLEAMALVSHDAVARAHAYTLERSNVYVRDMVLSAVDAERSIIDELCHDLAADFGNDSLSLILFGSYAHGEQTEPRDIDVFALAEDALHKQRLQERHLARGPWFFAKYGSSLSLMTFTSREAQEHLPEGRSALRTELMSTGIILHGLGVDEWESDAKEATNAAGASRGGSQVPRRG